MSVETRAKTKLAALMNEVQPVIDQHVENMSGDEIRFMLDKIPEFLRIDLKRDLESAQNKPIDTSKFDDLFNT
jgi:hypothetical protein